jgi:hypothetical protein
MFNSIPVSVFPVARAREEAVSLPCRARTHASLDKGRMGICDCLKQIYAVSLPVLPHLYLRLDNRGLIRKHP